MESNKAFALIITVPLFLIFSCGDTNSELSDNNKTQEEPTSANKIDACSVITAEELALIVNGEIKSTDDKAVFLEENEFYHYISLCNFYSSDNVINIRIAQKKKFVDPQKSRDSYYSIQKDDEDVTMIELVEVKGTTACYFELHEKDFDIKTNSLILFTGNFELTVTSDFMNKVQFVKAAEKILERLKN